MNRNRNLTVESLEGKMLLAVTAIGVGVHLLPAARVQAHLPNGPSTGIGFTAFGSTQAVSTASHQAHLPNGPSSGVGFTAFGSTQAVSTVSQAHLPHGPSSGIGFTGF